MAMGGGLDDIFGGGAPMTQTPAPAMGGDIGDIFGTSTPAPVATPSTPAAPTSASFIAFEDANIKVDFKCSRDASNSSIHNITAAYSNKTSGSISGLNMLVSVKKYLKLDLKPVSNSNLSPSQVEGSTQSINITNS